MNTIQRGLFLSKKLVVCKINKEIDRVEKQLFFKPVVKEEIKNMLNDIKSELGISNLKLRGKN